MKKGFKRKNSRKVVLKSISIKTWKTKTIYLLNHVKNSSLIYMYIYIIQEGFMVNLFINNYQLFLIFKRQ